MLSDQVPYFILDLLQQTPSVYVRGLGRFEAIFHPAVMDLPGSRIKPPYVQPEFNDDALGEEEVLPAYIQYTLGTDKNEINAAIDSFVSTIKERTAQGENFIIDQFGVFSKSSVGGIRFTPDWDAFNLSFSGLEALDLRAPAEIPVSRPYVPETRYTEPIPIAPTINIKPEPIVEEIITPKPEPELSVAQSGYQAGIEETTSRLWWMILGSALVLITVLCAYLAWDILRNRDRLNDLVINQPDTTAVVTEVPISSNEDSVPVEEDPSTIADTQEAVPPVSVPEEEKPVAPVTTPVKPPVNDGKVCYVIVGAFKDEANVIRMADRVSALGYEVEKITGGSLTRVAIKTSCDQTTLHQMLSEARSKLNPDAWLY